RPRLQGGAEGDAVQPAAEQLAPPDGPRLAGQDEEGGLEGVLRVGSVGEHAAAGGEDHRPGPPDQGRERPLVAPGDEALQQPGGAEAGGDRPGDLMDVAEQRAQPAVDHEGCPRRVACSLQKDTAAMAGCAYTDFSRCSPSGNGSLPITRSRGATASTGASSA